MVAGDIDHAGPVGEKVEDLLDGRDMMMGEIMFAELPSVYDITIEYKQSRFDAVQVADKLFCPAGISAKVQVGYYCYINGTFLHSKGLLKFRIEYNRKVKGR